MKAELTPEADLSSVTELQPTIEFVPGSRGRNSALVNTVFFSNGDRQGASRPRVRIDSVGSSSSLTDRFDESTRQLLRHRLMIAAITLICFILFVKILVLITGQTTTRVFLMRATTMALLGGILVVLYRSPRISLRWLRVIEVLVIAVPMTEALLVQYFETARLFESGEFERILTMRATIGGVVSLFIAIYGIFIPSDWRRTATILMIAALLPTVLTMFQWNAVPEEVRSGLPLFVTPALMFMMAVVGTLGAHVVHSIRRDAETALQYGQYRLTEEIGRGGMGIVYRAEHRMLKRPAAIKLIRLEAASKDGAVERFEREVQLMATLSHWNTVQIYDYGHTAAGDFYYVMEYLTGQTLAESLVENGVKNVESTVSIIIQICNGLEEAHDNTMVHRDLKPANIFLANCGGQRDVVKILDFGLAVSRLHVTQDDSVSGSPSYMSPEQILGESVDGRSDIYSIGCVFYECLVGRLLFDGRSITDVFNQHLGETRDLEQLPQVASGFAPIIEKCVSRNRADRFDNVAQLRAAIKEIKPVGA